MGNGREHIIVHYIAYAGLRAAQQHVLHRYHPHQMPVFIGNIAGVYGFLIHAGCPYVIKGLGHAHARLKADILRGHNAARAVLRVFQQLVYGLSVLRRGGIEYPAHNACRHFLYDIHGVVKVKLL